MNVTVPADDERHIEILATGLPCLGGAQLAVDVTLYSALRGNGTARPRAHWQDGAALLDAREDKDDQYPELLDGARCRLVVIAMETGGRFSHEAVSFVQALAQARARAAPSYLRRSTEYAFYYRWMGMLASAAARAYIASLIDDKEVLRLDSGIDGVCPWLPDAISVAGHDLHGAPSRLPLRGCA